MRNFGLAALAPLLLASAAPAPRYAVVHGWPILPEGRVLGPCSGVAVTGKGEVLVLHRGNRGTDAKGLAPVKEPVVEVFDGATGKLKREWGAGLFVVPHGISVGPGDHVWITDTGTSQVFEFTPDGALLRTLGERGVPGADATHFDRPTDVAPMPDGSFYVADGYGNSRVAKFAADGRLIFQWGTRGTGPGQFNIPHALAVDGKGRVFVADRVNDRVQVFDGTSHYLTEWKSPAIGRPFGLALLPGSRIAILDGGANPDKVPDHDGVTIATLDGRPVGHFGRMGNQDGQFWIAHDIAADRA
ncbi:MAG TPA: peptidyl-alpha-hydroxyglycine alpha-amidating lyase family protein, partial [Sphingomonas sp.]|nr:peptidyl-alpha-hydroxyglycine alpha-amidating lyase family protein [Sphingomonas sp.]